MTNPYTDREVLEIFVESVDELFESGFVKGLAKPVQVKLQSGSGTIISQLTGPDREAVKACLLTLRFFCQDNDQTSLNNMAKRVPSLPVDLPLKDDFLTSRDNLNTYFQKSPSIQVQGVGADTNWAIFDTFLYGVFAHAKPSKRRTVKCWETQAFYHELEAQFYVVMAEFIRAIGIMAKTCRKMLESPNLV